MFISTKKIEKAFGRKVIPSTTCLGVDTASRTGWCKADTLGLNNVTFDYGFINIDSRDKYFKYNRYIDAFKTFEKCDKVIIEEAFYGLNAKTFQMLSRLGAFAYSAAYLNKVKDIRFILATSARAYLGLKGNAKKAIIQEEFKKRLALKLDDEDIIDAMILSLVGILE